MNLLIKRRQLIMAALVFALGSAVFVNWYFTKPENAAVDSTVKVVQTQANLGDAALVNSDEIDDDSEEEEKEGRFSAAALARSKAHSEAFDLLNTVIQSEKSSESAVSDATEQLAKLTEAIKLEADIEALIDAKTGAKSIALINNGHCEIAVEKSALGDSTVLQIMELAAKHTGIEAENISIFEAK